MTLTGVRLGGWLVASVAIAVVVLAAVAEPAPVRLASTFPTDGAELDAPPAEVSIAFSALPRPETFHLTVAPDGGGAPVSGAARVDGPVLTVPVSITGTGGYVVGYHVLLADGHQLSGSTRFSVTTTGAPVTRPRDLSGAGGAAAGHDHAGRDPLSLGLLAVNLVLIATLLVVMIRRPRPRRSPPVGGRANP